MFWNLWNTLIRPDKEELQNPEKTVVARAANHLQIGEFQLLQLAYREWHSKDLPLDQVDMLFHTYMIDDQVPHWAQHYCHQILRLAETNRLDANAPRYHRFDHEFRSDEHGRIRQFVFATSCVLLFVGGGILLADRTTNQTTALFPPYFENDQSANSGDGRVDPVGIVRLP